MPSPIHPINPAAPPPPTKTPGLGRGFFFAVFQPCPATRVRISLWRQRAQGYRQWKPLHRSPRSMAPRRRPRSPRFARARARTARLGFCFFGEFPRLPGMFRDSHRGESALAETGAAWMRGRHSRPIRIWPVLTGAFRPLAKIPRTPPNIVSSPARAAGGKPVAIPDSCDCGHMRFSGCLVPARATWRGWKPGWEASMKGST